MHHALQDACKAEDNCTEHASMLLGAHLGGFKPASTDIALPKDALVAQDAIGLVLLVVQEVTELVLA